MTKAIEFYTSGINSRTTYANENQSTELYKQLQIIFPLGKTRKLCVNINA